MLRLRALANDPLVVLVTFLVVFMACLIATGSETKPSKPPEATSVRVLHDRMTDSPVLVYEIGDATHFVRLRSIVSMSWIEDPQQVEMSFSGKTLRSNMSLSEFLTATEAYNEGKRVTITEWAAEDR